MNPVPDDVLLPCHWLREEISEDRMEFRRDDARFAISAERSGECPPFPTPFLARVWRLRCHQRAGEATSTTSLGCVTTRELALDTVLRYMDRINEAIEGGVDLTPSAMVDLLVGEEPIDEHDEWGRHRRTTKRVAADEFIQ